jgi:RND superfamily putative drug exporter
VAGIPTGLRDNRDYYNHDILFIVFTTIIIVFLILVVLLRAIIAPLYLIGSVLISFLSAMGIGVIVFQFVLGQDLHWSLPGLSFILLVSVGADYNMLLISRIREESPHGVRVGVIRTVGSTGGVITSAGLIFAASMFGLLGASISTMAEAGFIIGMGIVLDTFLVRTITVPALAALIGQANWWPSRLGSRDARRLSARKPVRKSNWLPRLPRLNGTWRRNTHSPVLQPPTIVVPSLHNESGSDDGLLVQALPLFGPSGLPDRLTNAHQAATSHLPMTTNGNGKKPADDLPGHALPLFGPSGLPHNRFPTTTSGHANSNGHAEGNGKRPTDQLPGHALRLLDTDGPLHHPANGHQEAAPGSPTTNGDGSGTGNRPTDQLPGHALPLFGTNGLLHHLTNIQQETT